MSRLLGVALVVLVVADEARANAEVFEHPSAMASIFCRNEWHGAQHAEGALGDVAQVSDRRGHNKERSQTSASSQRCQVKTNQR